MGRLRYIGYLSPSKVHNLYSQITNYELTRIQTGNSVEIGGNVTVGTGLLKRISNFDLNFGGKRKKDELRECIENDIQKLKKLLKYCDDKKLIYTIDSKKERLNPDDAILYRVIGNFIDKGNTNNLNNDTINIDYNLAKMNEFNERESRIVTIETKVHGLTISLDCSYDNFWDCRSQPKLGRSISSGMRFFEYDMPYSFEAIFVPLGRKRRTIYGSPVVLLHSFTM